MIGKGIAKAHKMDVLVVDSYDNVLKKLTTIRRNPEEDNFKVGEITGIAWIDLIVVYFGMGRRICQYLLIMVAYHW